MEDDGKSGFVITLVALLVMTGTFGAMAFRGTSDTGLFVLLLSMTIAAVGHLLLGGAEFRKQMLADRKKDED